MISIMPITLEHVAALDNPAAEEGLKSWVTSEQLRAMVLSGTSFSGFINGKFLGCAGYSQIGPGVAYAWFWGTEEIHKYPVLVHVVIRRALKFLHEEKGNWRIACEVREGNKRAERWMGLLGFEYEGTQRKRGPDKSNFHLFAKIAEDE